MKRPYIRNHDRLDLNDFEVDEYTPFEEWDEMTDLDAIDKEQSTKEYKARQSIEEHMERRRMERELEDIMEDDFYFDDDQWSDE